MIGLRIEGDCLLSVLYDVHVELTLHIILVETLMHGVLASSVDLNILGRRYSVVKLAIIQA